MWMQFTTTIAANGDQAYILVPFKTMPGIGENNISKLGAFINQSMNFFPFIKAVVEMLLSCAQGIAKYSDGIFGQQIGGKALLIKKQGGSQSCW